MAMPMHKGADGVWQDDPAAQHRTAHFGGSENCVKTAAGSDVHQGAAMGGKWTTSHRMAQNSSK